MIRFSLLLLMLGTPAVAQSVGDCGDIVSARNLPEPWGEYTDTYANGDVRVAVIDTIEPAAAAVHLMVLSLPRNEIGDRQCKLVSLDRSEGGGPIGLFSLDFAARQAEYDPSRGLVLTMPVGSYVPETGGQDIGEMTVTINQSTGKVTAEVSGS